MTEQHQSPQHNILLNISIGLLAFFIIFQLYGIFSSPHPVLRDQQSNALDTAVVRIQINILNGCGINGVGTTLTTFCRNRGYDVVEMGNYKSFDVNETMIIDRCGKMETAHQIARQIGISRKNVVQQFSNEQLVTASIVIGKDFKKLIPWNK